MLSLMADREYHSPGRMETRRSRFSVLGAPSTQTSTLATTAAGALWGNAAEIKRPKTERMRQREKPGKPHLRRRTSKPPAEFDIEAEPSDFVARADNRKPAAQIPLQADDLLGLPGQVGGVIDIEVLGDFLPDCQPGRHLGRRAQEKRVDPEAVEIEQLLGPPLGTFGQGEGEQRGRAELGARLRPVLLLVGFSQSKKRQDILRRQRRRGAELRLQLAGPPGQGV